MAGLWLAGCATPQAPNFPGERLQGRLSVQAENGQGGNGSFELLGTARAGQFELSTPLGTLAARARWAEGRVTLEAPGEPLRSYPDLDALSQDLLGESLPVAALFDWLRGQPWPQAPASPLAEPARGFEQLGWRIELDRFEQGFIVARRIAGPAVTLRARLNT